MREEDTQTVPRVDCASYGRPFVGERVSGDVTVIQQSADVLFMAIIDVLGHGPDAHALAIRMQEFLKNKWQHDVVATVLQLHSEFKGTRGAAAGLGVLDTATGELRYTGIGNTVVRKFGARMTRLPSTAGIIGSQIRTPAEHMLHMTPTDVILFYTDGVRDHFAFDEYRQLSYDSARTIARTIINRFGKAHDDATCIALRYGR